MFCIDRASYIHGITSKCLHGCKFIFSFNFISGYDEIHMYDFKVLIRIFLNYYLLHLCTAFGERFFLYFFFLRERIVILQGDSVSAEISVAQILMFNYWNLFYFVCSYFVPFFHWEKQWSNQLP